MKYAASQSTAGQRIPAIIHLPKLQNIFWGSTLFIMKLRIRGNSIRLRLTQTEVSNLAKLQPVEETTDFGSGQVFVYSITAKTKCTDLSVSFLDGHLAVQIPETAVKGWETSDTVGISHEQGKLKLLIEKDFNCLTPRDTDEDTDTFPHPKNAEC